MWCPHLAELHIKVLVFISRILLSATFVHHKHTQESFEPPAGTVILAPLVALVEPSHPIQHHNECKEREQQRITLH